MSFIYFILFLGGLIFFHELGHYLVARLVGVTVIRFSIGFGPKLVGFTYGGTEYQLSLLPLGGYVKFLGDDPEDLPVPGDARRGFLTTDLWRKSLIAVAGPIFNLVLPLLIFFPMFMGESKLAPAIFGTVSKDGPAWSAGLRSGDVVVGINDEKIDYWWQLLDIVSDSPGEQLTFNVRRNDEVLTKTVVPVSVPIPQYRDMGFELMAGRIEVAAERSLPVVTVEKGGLADQAGLRPFDAIVEINSRPVDGWDDVRKALESIGTGTVTLKVAATEDGSRTPGEYRTVQIGPLAEGQTVGVNDATFVFTAITAGSPADRAGVKNGDVALDMDGASYSDWAFWSQDMARDPDTKRNLRLGRGDETVTVTFDLKNPDWQAGAAVPKYVAFGAWTRQAAVSPEPIPNNDRLWYSLTRTAERTGDIILATVAGLASLAMGHVSVKEMGGPILIYDIAASAGQQGWASFFGALAWLSVSLGILNLLPIPVLDGGHLVFFGIEAITRKPVSNKGRQIATYIGFGLLMLLMVTVFANDIDRKWGALSDIGSGAGK